MERVRPGEGDGDGEEEGEEWDCLPPQERLWDFQSAFWQSREQYWVDLHWEQDLRMTVGGDWWQVAQEGVDMVAESEDKGDWVWVEVGEKEGRLGRRWEVDMVRIRGLMLMHFYLLSLYPASLCLLFAPHGFVCVSLAEEVFSIMQVFFIFQTTEV